MVFKKHSDTPVFLSPTLYKSTFQRSYHTYTLVENFQELGLLNLTKVARPSFYIDVYNQVL
jgi:hypothetical protein